MPAPEELQQDKDFMSATPADQIKYLSSTDPEFKAAHPDDQAAYLAHVTKQPTGEEASAPAKSVGEAVDIAGQHYERGTGVSSALGRLGTMVPAMAKSAYHAAVDEVKPEETAEGFTHRGPSLAAKRAILDPSASAYGHIDEMARAQDTRFKQAGKETPTSGKIAEAGGKALSMVPMVGPYALGLGERAAKGDVSGAVTEALGMSMAPEVMKEALPGGELPGAAPKGSPALPTVEAGVRGLGKAYQATREVAPEAGAAIGGTLGAVKGPGGAAYGMYTGGRVGKILQKITPEGNAAAEFGLSTEDRNVQRLEKAKTTADKAADKAAQDHSVYTASEEHGAIDPAVNPAYKKSMEALKKAKDAQAEAHFHLQEAKRAAQEAEANRGAIEGQAKDITPEEVAAARPESATPTDAELKTRQEKLMGDIENKVGIEKPAATPENVKLPGQVQPETVPQEPTPAPRVDETTQMRPLAGNKGTIVGRSPRLLTEGTPEAATAAPEAPKTPLGEILPPEKPAKPGRLGSLKAEGGKVVDAEPEVQQKIEEGLRKGSAEAKPVALRPLGAAEEKAPLGGKIETPEWNKEQNINPKTPANYDASKDQIGVREKLDYDQKHEVPKEEPKKAERTPEDLSKIKKLMADHTDQELLREAQRRGIDESQYDLSKREGPNRHRVDRDKLVNDLVDKIPEDEKDKLVDLSDKFDSKDDSTWTNAEKSNLNRAQRARAIMQEHKGGPKEVSGGSQGADVEIPKGAKVPEKVAWNKPTGEYNDSVNEKTIRENTAIPPDEEISSIRKEYVPIEKLSPRGIGEERTPYDYSSLRGSIEGEGLPPVQTMKYGDKYYISDGSHRVSEWKSQGMTHAPSWVVETKPVESDVAGSEESSAKDREHFAQAKRELPNGTISEQLLRAQELKEKAQPGTKEAWDRLRKTGKTTADNEPAAKPVVAESDEEMARRGVNIPEPVDVAKSADEYNKSQGLPEIKREKLEKSPRAAEIGKAYDEMEHTPDDEATKKSYNALIDDTKKQWDYVTKDMGINIVPTDEDPYPSHEAMVKDLTENKRLKVYRGGTPLEEGHNLAEVDPDTHESYNTMFRAVHDIFGHAAQGHDFSEAGEESAWNTHRQMMSPEAIPAMTTETRAQVSSFFKNGEQFPAQKTGILPNFAMEKEGAADHSKAIADLHNEGGGSTYNPTKGDMGGADAYAVPMHPELFRVVDSEKVTPEQIKKFMELPAVKKAMDANPDLSVGTWANDGKSYLDLSATIPDKAEAIKLGKDNNQKAITYLKTREDIPTGGTGTGTPLEPKPLDQNPEVKAVQDMKEEANKPKDGLLNKAYRAYSQSSFSGEEGKVNLGDKGIAKAMPTGDQLIKKYGESSGDPAHTAFILPDGRGVALGAVDHDTMLGGKATDKVPRRDQFVDSGNIRIRPRTGGKAGREFSISIPESGITEDQLAHLNKMAPQLSSGTVMVEIGKRGGEYKSIPYGEASKSLETTLRDLAPIKEAEKPLGDLAEKHLTPEERQGVTKSPQQQERFIQRMEQMPEVQEWTDAAKKGAGERKWYQRGTQAFDAMSKEAPEYFDQPGDRDKFIGMLASGSPQQSVAMNMREALRVWTNYVDNGRPTGAALEKLLSKPSDKGGFTLPGAKIPNTMKALAGEPLWPDITKNKNFKVPSFRDNLTGVLDKVTNDGWMALFSGLDARDVTSAHSYHPISVMTRAAADELGWEPAEAQAAIWAFIKTLTEKGVDASEDPHEMRQYSEDFADIILHDPETRNLLKDMGVDHAKLDERLAREVEGKPEPKSGEVSPTGEDSSRRAIERVEKARGKGTIPPPKTGLLKFGESEPDASTSFKPEEFKSGDNPKQIAKNASGESSASMEAINRAKSEKSKGTKYYRIDSRSGVETPIIGADALDATAGPYEHIVRRGPDGEVTLDSGRKARPLGIIKSKK